MIGTLLNGTTVVIGAFIGLLLKRSLSEKLVESLFNAIGLCTLLLGVSMALQSENLVFVFMTVVIGTFIGELIRFDNGIIHVSSFLKRHFAKNNPKFSEGLIDSFFLFCVGSLTILGPLEEGLGRGMAILLTKSLLDGIAAIILSVRLGNGVLFASIPLIIVQGSIALMARSVQPFMTDGFITEISAVGGVLLMGLGINLLELKKIRVSNMLLSLPIFVLLYFLIMR